MTNRVRLTSPYIISCFRSYVPLLFRASPSISFSICPGFFANNGRWSGVSFGTLLKNANVHQEAKYLDVKGVYGKVVRISLKDIDRKRIFLAYRVNGEILPQKHGFPLRLVNEDAYGFDWVKYVEEIVIS